MEWDDLRFVLAVSRTGSALGAAKALGVNQTTVTRRVSALEENLGARLFERRASGYEATPLGQEAARIAGRMEAEAQAFADHVAGRLRALSGAVLVSTSDAIANLLVAPCLQAFHKRHPGVRVDVDATDRRVDVARGEADVALRAGSRPEGAGVVARRLPDNDWAVYCSRAYCEEHGCPAEPAAIQGHSVVDIQGTMGRIPAATWLVAQTAPENVRLRSNSLMNLVSNLRSGLGLGALPCVLGDSEPDLVRCFPPPPELRSEMWLIVRAEIKDEPHVRALTDFLAAHVAGQRLRLAPSLAAT